MTVVSVVIPGDDCTDVLREQSGLDLSPLPV